MLIAQISDTHIRACGKLMHGLIDTEQALIAAIDHVDGLCPRPDVVLATGDLTDWGRAKDYRMLRRELDRLPMPVYVIPGNHDDRAALREVFADCAYLPQSGEFLHYTVEHFPYRLIGLDTVIPGEVGGGMCDERLAWLETRLSEQPDRATLIFMHHPPVVSGIGFMDTPDFLGMADLHALIARSPQVRQIICGHLHRPLHVSWAGTTVAVAPSTVYQMTLAFGDDDGFFHTQQPPAIALYLWRDRPGQTIQGSHSQGPVGFVSLIGAQENKGSRGRNPAFVAPDAAVS